MRIGLTVGHAGRLSRINDRGASYQGIEEVSLIRQYTDALDIALRKLGHECLIFSDGQYSEQWLRVDNAKCDIYFNCHINAGKGDYGLFLYDYRSTKGPMLADAIKKSMAKFFPKYPVKVLACRADTNGVARDGDFSEAFGCINGVKAIALCLEPYFIDGPNASYFRENVELLAQAIAEGIDSFSKI